MQITFEPGALSDKEVAGLMAMLAAIYPDAAPAVARATTITAIAASPVSVGDPVRTIANDDRPDVGAAPVPALSVSAGAGGAAVNPTLGAAAAFGKQPAPSTAVADQSPSAPAGPTAGVPMPPTVPSPPAASDPTGFAPSEPAAQTNLAGGVELDSRGLPWDHRIHSSGKAKVAAGTWKQKRGVDDAVIAAVEAELRAAMAVPGPTAAAPVPPPAGVPLPPAPATVPAGAVPIPPVPDIPAAAPTPPVTAGPLTFPQLMQKVTGAISSGRLTQAQVTTCVQTTGLPSLALLASRPDLVAAAGAEIDRVLNLGLQ